MRLLSREQQSSQWYSKLLTRGIFDTPLAPFDERDDRIKYASWFSKLWKIKRDKGNWQTYELWPAPQSHRWLENHLTPATHDPITDYWAIELARFFVPDGNIGYVTRIEQVVNDSDGSYYPSNVSYWGSPQFVDPDVDNLRWYLTLSYYGGTQPPRHNVTSTVPIPVHSLPGAPYPDLNELDGIWYPAHNCKNLNLLIPGARVLRFFLITPPTTNYTWQVSGKLSGYTQSTYQTAAVHNSREIQ